MPHKSEKKTIQWRDKNWHFDWKTHTHTVWHWTRNWLPVSLKKRFVIYFIIDQLGSLFITCENVLFLEPKEPLRPKKISQWASEKGAYWEPLTLASRNISFSRGLKSLLFAYTKFLSKKVHLKEPIKGLKEFSGRPNILLRVFKWPVAFFSSEPQIFQASRPRDFKL